MKKLVKFFVLATILLSLPMRANAQTSIKVSNDGVSMTVRLKSSTTYEHPYAGIEFTMGPEKTIYYAIHYNENGKAQYGEIIRDVDNFVLERVYPDGTYDEFTPPPLTKKQIQDFNEKYDPVQVKKRILEKEKEMARERDKTYSDLIEKDFIKLTKGDNYTINMYTKPHKEAFRLFSFSDVNYGNTVERNYDFDVETVKNNIIPILDNAKLAIPLKVSLVPYQCEDFPQGAMEYTMFKEDENQYELHILLFNNKISMEEQFNIQFKEYLQEIKRREHISNMVN